MRARHPGQPVRAKRRRFGGDRGDRAGCRRVWLVTTNDNVDALAFYQRRGFRLAALHRAAVTEARETLKPEIPEVARNGIPIRDELELELEL